MLSIHSIRQNFTKIHIHTHIVFVCLAKWLKLKPLSTDFYHQSIGRSIDKVDQTNVLIEIWLSIQINLNQILNNCLLSLCVKLDSNVKQQQQQQQLHNKTKQNKKNKNWNTRWLNWFVSNQILMEGFFLCVCTCLFVCLFIDNDNVDDTTHMCIYYMIKICNEMYACKKK